MASAPSRSAGCPVTPTVEISDLIAPGIGPGPVYPVIGGSGNRVSIAGAPRTSFDRYAVKTLWVATDPADERIVVRVGAPEGQTPEPGFLRGSVLTEDGLPTQLRLGPDGSLQFGGGPMPEGWRAWSSATMVPGSGCYAFQIDVQGRTALVAFEVTD